MAVRRCLLELGMGVDLHGRNATTAARRAVADVLARNSLEFVRRFGAGPDSLRVDITIGVPAPDEVDRELVLQVLPHGRGSVHVVAGGLEVPSADGSDATVVANAAVLVSLDMADEPRA